MRWALFNQCFHAYARSNSQLIHDSKIHDIHQQQDFIAFLICIPPEHFFDQTVCGCGAYMQTKWLMTHSTQYTIQLVSFYCIWLLKWFWTFYKILTFVQSNPFKNMELWAFLFKRDTWEVFPCIWVWEARGIFFSRRHVLLNERTIQWYFYFFAVGEQQGEKVVYALVFILGV